MLYLKRENTILKFFKDTKEAEEYLTEKGYAYLGGNKYWWKNDLNDRIRLYEGSSKNNISYEFSEYFKSRGFSDDALNVIDKLLFHIHQKDLIEMFEYYLQSPNKEKYWGLKEKEKNDEKVKEAIKGVNKIKPFKTEENVEKYEFNFADTPKSNMNEKLKSILNTMANFIEVQDFPVRIESTRNILEYLSDLSYRPFCLLNKNYTYDVVEGDFDFIKIYHGTDLIKSLGLNISVYNLPDYKEGENNEESSDTI
jgi:hypothetical protein